MVRGNRGPWILPVGMRMAVPVLVLDARPLGPHGVSGVPGRLECVSAWPLAQPLVLPHTRRTLHYTSTMVDSFRSSRVLLLFRRLVRWWPHDW